MKGFVDIANPPFLLVSLVPIVFTMGTPIAFDFLSEFVIEAPEVGVTDFN